MSPDGTYKDVTPIKNSIVFNTGDLLECWSNGLFKATLHRVVLPKEREKLRKARQSIVFFTNPDDNYVIETEDENGNMEFKKVKEHIDERNNTTILEVRCRKLSIK